MTIRYHLSRNPVHPPYDFNFNPVSHQPGHADPLPLMEESASVHTLLPHQQLENFEITWPVHPHTIAMRLFGAWDALHERAKLRLGEQQAHNAFLTFHFASEDHGPRSLILVNGYTTQQLWDMLSLLKKHSHDTGPVPTIQLLASALITIPSHYTWQTNNPGPLGRVEVYTQYLNWPWMGHPPRQLADYFEISAAAAHRSNSVWSHRTFSPHKLRRTNLRIADSLVNSRFVDDLNVG